MNATPSTIDRLIEAEYSRAREVIEIDGDELINTFIAQTRDGSFLVIQTPWRDNEERHFAIEKLRELFRNHKVVRYCNSCEAWMSTQAASTGNRPSQSSDRIEVLAITGIDQPSETKKAIFYPIERLPGGKRRLGEPKHGNEEIEGELTGLLDVAGQAPENVLPI
jgi:hypothetical protein